VGANAQKEVAMDRYWTANSDREGEEPYEEDDDGAEAADIARHTPITLEQYVRFWLENGNAELGGGVFVAKARVEGEGIHVEMIAQIALNADSDMSYRRFNLSGNEMVMIHE
jgi:hypothetical protein